MSKKLNLIQKQLKIDTAISFRILSYFIVLVFLLQSLSINAQDIRTIAGKVTSEENEPIPGVSISIENTGTGTITGIDGRYSLGIQSSDQVLIFSFIGMERQKITIGNQSVIDVKLQESNVNLDEVVIVGYGSLEKKDVTGAIASVKSDEIMQSGSGSMEQALSGRVAGVVVNASDNAPGAGINIKIRGTNSINASSAPLYVIDGFPVEGSFGTGNDQESTRQSPLSGIDPYDIESIDILKDASATAIYGARGANGVVIITTKNSKDGRLSLNFNAQGGVQTLIEKYETMDGLGYAEIMHNRIFPFDKRITPPDEEESNFIWWDYEELANNRPSTDWVDEITQMGSIQNYNLSVSGGTKKANFLGSISYYKNEGLVKNTDFDRVTGNFKVNAQPKDWVKLGFNSRFSKTGNSGTVTINSAAAAQFAGIIQQAIRTSPLRSPDEDFIVENEDFSDGVIGNPLTTVNDVKMDREDLQTLNNASVILMPWGEDIQFKSVVGLSANSNDYYFFAPSSSPWGLQQKGRASIRNRKFTSWLNENTVSINKKIGKDNKINGLIGVTYQKDAVFITEQEATNFPIENLGYNNMRVAESYSAPYSAAEESVLLSYLGRVNYSFKQRYILTASFRADGSSKFSENNKWGYFPSLALAWRASEESFIKELNVFDNLKFRAGWGETGNPNISPYQSLVNYGIAKYANGDQLNTAISPITPGNPELKWERTVQTNIGLDMAFFKSRLAVTVDAYIKDTEDLLLNGDINPSTGFPTYLYNSGKVENKGLEIALNGVVIDKTKLKWNSDFNIGFNRTTVVDLGELTTTDFLYVPGTNNFSQAIIKEGEPIGLWYGYETDGIWLQNEFTWDGATYVLNSDENGNVPAAIGTPQPGMRKYKDLSGPDGVPDGIINSFDKKVIGISQPKFTAGFNNSFEYANFDCSVFLEASYGKDIYNANNRFLIESVGGGNNVLKADYWEPIQYALDENGLETDEILDPGNPDGKYPRVGYGDPYQDNHDAYIEDGSYLRIKNVSLGYTFRKTITGVNALRIYANIINLHTFTKYSGYDPNVTGRDLGGLRPGYDLSSYPLARTFLLGVNVNF